MKAIPHLKSRYRVLLAAPAFLGLGGCLLDPDIYLQAFLQILAETAVFVLTNLLVGVV